MRTYVQGAVTALLLSGSAWSEGLTLTAPVEYQVVQRSTRTRGTVPIAGKVGDADRPPPSVEARVVVGGSKGEWQALKPNWSGAAFVAGMEVPAGGWHRLEVRASQGGGVVSTAVVEHFGIGEVFVVAGQSNSANHGEEKQKSSTGLVAASGGSHWQLANDPQPGASGRGGSFLPPLGDALAEEFEVPIGFVPCGIGATSVREWLPKGAQFPNPPTIERRVQKRPDGLWESKGEAYTVFIARMKGLGPKGFRAVLWHQGESDANQRDATRTLPGRLYRLYLEKLIRESRKELGWKPPWFVAQVSYHVPGDEADPDIRAAQASLWKDGIALEGPDSDAIKGRFREREGQGVHFSGPGLREHASQWHGKVAPWVSGQLVD